MIRGTPSGYPLQFKGDYQSSNEIFVGQPKPKLDCVKRYSLPISFFIQDAMGNGPIQREINKDIFNPNFFDPKLSQPKLFSNQIYPKLLQTRFLTNQEEVKKNLRIGLGVNTNFVRGSTGLNILCSKTWRPKANAFREAIL